jgi:hypothetical protein
VRTGTAKSQQGVVAMDVRTHRSGSAGSSDAVRPRLLAVRTRAAGDNDWTTAEPRADSVPACWPATQQRLRAERSTDELRRRLRRLDAFVWTVGLVLLAVAAAATSVYWKYSLPLEQLTTHSSRRDTF